VLIFADYVVLEEGTEGKHLVYSVSLFSQQINNILLGAHGIKKNTLDLQQFLAQIQLSLPDRTNNSMYHVNKIFVSDCLLLMQGDKRKGKISLFIQFVFLIDKNIQMKKQGCKHFSQKQEGIPREKVNGIK
jgi:hypothetical protein